MKKAGVLVFILLLSIVAFSISVSAANETFVDKAYSCLESKVDKKCSSLTFEEQVFSLLALRTSECRTAITSKSKNSECWPSTTCNIKDTALAVLALSSADQNTDKPEKWLLRNNVTPSDVEWYLEIDASQASTCTVSYDSKSVKIIISEDKKISTISDSCLSSAFNSNWIKIASSCLKKRFTVSCDQSFISTILFKKASSNIWRISPNTQSQSAGGTTEHQINFFCFSTGSTCNYEDNLWATLTLQKAGYDVSAITPYLIVLADDNPKYFPDPFLYIITSTDEYFRNMVDAQKTEGYWDIDNKRYYNTAEALLALTLTAQANSQSAENAKSWLEKVQDTNGCWNSGNIRDTGFLLWAAYPKSTTPICTGNDCGTTKPDCQTVGNGYCMTSSDCIDAGGDYQSMLNFGCSGSGIQLCCDKPKKEQSCSDMQGKICPSGETCSEYTVNALGTSECCLADCLPETTECESEGYTCKSICSSTEQEEVYECDSGDMCCKAKSSQTPSPGYWWIWLLVILIIIVILAIIFRDRLRMTIFKFKNKGNNQPVNKTRPPYFPPGQQPMMRPMQPRYYPPARPASKPVTKSDKEMEDTFRKLRDMSK